MKSESATELPVAPTLPEQGIGHPRIVRLSWTAESKPTKKVAYNHTIAETPFGRFLLTWKGWKENSSLTMGFDETPWGGVHYDGWGSVEDAQRWAEDQMLKRCKEILEADSGQD